MGRTIVFESNLQSAFGNLLDIKNGARCGILIGQQTSSKDFIVHLVNTPNDEDDEAENENENTPKVKTKEKKKNSTALIDDFTDTWFTLHAKQVHRMLPGGLSIIGVFGAVPQNLIDTSLSKLRTFLIASQKMVVRSDTRLYSEEDVTDRIILRVCQTTKKIICQSFDVSDLKGSPKLAEMKFQSFVENWVTLHTKMEVDTFFLVPKKEPIPLKFPDQLEVGLTPFCEQIWKAMGKIGGLLRKPDEPLQISSQKKKGKGKSIERDDVIDYPVDFYFVPLEEESKSIGLVDICKKIRIKGMIYGHAFINNKATCAEALMYLKEDIVRSLRSRCELLYEDILGAKEDDTRSRAMDCPVRVLGHVRESPIVFCDYAFTDESIPDILDRFHEILDIPIEAEYLDRTVERQIEQSALESSADELDQAQGLKKKAPISSQFGYYGLLASGAMGLLAVAISYLYFGDENIALT